MAPEKLASVIRSLILENRRFGECGSALILRGATAKARRWVQAQRLGPLLQLCKMTTVRLSVQLDKSGGQWQPSLRHILRPVQSRHSHATLLAADL